MLLKIFPGRCFIHAEFLAGGFLCKSFNLFSYNSAVISESESFCRHPRCRHVLNPQISGLFSLGMTTYFRGSYGPQRFGVWGFTGQKKPSSGTLTAFALCKGPVLLVISKDEFRITGKNSASEKRPTILLHAHVENPWLAHVQNFPLLKLLLTILSRRFFQATAE